MCIHIFHYQGLAGMIILWVQQKHNLNSTIVPELKLIMKEVYIKSVANEAIDTYFQKKKIVLITHYWATSIINTTKLVTYQDIKNWHSFERQWNWKEQ